MLGARMLRVSGVAAAGGLGAYYVQQRSSGKGPAALAARRSGLAAFAGPVAPGATGPFGNPAVRARRQQCGDERARRRRRLRRPACAAAPRARAGFVTLYSLSPPLLPQHGWDYYSKCLMGGILSCGLTHLAVTPLDVVKCRMQTQPECVSRARGAALLWAPRATPLLTCTPLPPRAAAALSSAQGVQGHGHGL